MSIALMTLVFYISPDECDAPEKIVLLSLADHADDEGGSIHPSNGRTTWKCSMTERGIQRIIDRLEKKGLLRTIGYGGGRHKVNNYEIDVDNVAAISRNPRLPFRETPTLKPETPTLKPETPTLKPGNPDPGSPDPSYNHQEPKASPRTAGDAPEEEDMDLQYEPCNDDGSPIIPRFGQRPKWAIPEDHPVLKRAMEVTGRKWWKDRGEKALWKPVKSSLAGHLISAEWVEFCLAFAAKKQEQKKPISLGSLLLYMVNVEKMQDWLVKQGKATSAANVTPTTISTSSVAEPYELPEWNSPYDQS